MPVAVSAQVLDWLIVPPGHHRVHAVMAAVYQPWFPLLGLPILIAGMFSTEFAGTLDPIQAELLIHRVCFGVHISAALLQVVARGHQLVYLFEPSFL